MTELPVDLSVADLLPHRGRMLLIDEVVHIEEDRAVAQTRVNAQWPLAGGDSVSSLLIIELVAQTSGLGNGLNLIKRQGKGADKKGWIVGVKKASLYIEALPMGADIVIEAYNRFKFDAFIEIEGFAKIDDQKIGEVILQVIKAETDSDAV